MHEPRLHPPAEQLVIAATADDTDSADEALLRRIQHHDEQALTLLYTRYAGVIYHIALRITNDHMVAEGVLQDVFHAVWRFALSFRANAPVLPWLIGIAYHRALDARRARQYRSRARETALIGDQASVRRFAQDETSLAQEHKILIQQALATLAPDQRQAITLAYYADLTQCEIAERLHAPLGTVKSRVRLGLRHLQKVLREYEG